MRKLLLLTFFIVNLSVFGQDTISVQTFTYDSISTRRAMFDFPDELQGQRFEKVLLYYNLKCSPLTPWDSYNCGEWDYLTNTTIFNHTGVYDSIEVQGPEFLVNGEDVPTVAYTTNPYYHYYQNYQYFINYSSQVDNDYAIGSGTVTTMNPFGTANDRQHTQLLWTANELLAAGVTAGDIAKLRFDVATLGSSLNNLTIKIKHTSSTTVTGYEVGGFSTVYHLNTTLAGTGIQTINLTNPFYYNGTDNLLIDISYHNAGAGVNTILNATNTIDNSVVTTSENLGLLNIDAGNHVEVDLDDYDFQGQVTIAFWANGDATYLPANTSVIEGLDSINQRMLNIHFPWSNSRMYWDAGAGSGYDRIDKAATANEISNNWNHWAFTKQQTTGEMKVYKNGVLWHSGNGLTRTIGTVNKFRIGTSGNGSFDYAGKIDEFQIWNAELPAATIANWMNQKITTAHPNYNNLVLYYDFDNSQHIIDKSVNNRNGMTTTPGMVVPSAEVPVGFELSTLRPNITFVQGTYTSSLDSILVVDSVLAQTVDIAEYGVAGRKFVISNITHGFEPGYSYTYNYLGQKIDSTLYSATVSLNNNQLSYFQKPFEILKKFEIGRFITPYGIGFDLGPNGFTWVYDVTDYQSLLLSDTVDLQAHNTQELIDVRFDFITGVPPRDVKNVEVLWEDYGNHLYGNIASDTDLSQIAVDLDSTASNYKLKTRITGHGHEGNGNCCEWQSKTFSILVDGSNQFSWNIWQPTECADNPNIGQGGTWPYAREGWCPGDKVPEYDFELTPHVTPGTTVNLDYGISSIPTNDAGQANGNYRISTHLISYGAPNFNLDAAVIDVLNPNDWEYYSKWNPTCRNPRIVIKNTGSVNLTSAKIKIWVGDSGWQDVTYQWTGDLAFLEEAEVEIPIENHFWFEDQSGALEFHAKISEPNGGQDEYPNNDQYNVKFESPQMIDGPFYIWMKSNNKAYENKIYLKDVNGNVIWSRETMANSTVYRDTFDLAPGCYSVELYDSDDDGLSFWYSSQVQGETAGYLRFRKVGGSILHTVDPDFGRYTRYDFTVGYGLGLEEDKTEAFKLNVFPNPSDGNVRINLDNFKGEQVELNIYSITGDLVRKIDVGQANIDGYYTVDVNLEGVAKGIYFVNAIADRNTATQQLIIH